MNYLKQISPVSVIFGCQILVKHFTFGGCQRIKQRLQRVIYERQIAPSPSPYLLCSVYLSSMKIHKRQTIPIPAPSNIFFLNFLLSYKNQVLGKPCIINKSMTKVYIYQIRNILMSFT